MVILIGSSQSIVHSALLTLLNNQPDMIVIGQAQSASDLLVLPQTIKTDVVLVEWGLLGRSAAETIHALHCLTSPPIVIVFGRQPGWSQEALDAGADAFFWEGQGPKALLTITRKLMLEANLA